MPTFHIKAVVSTFAEKITSFIIKNTPNSLRHYSCRKFLRSDNANLAELTSKKLITAQRFQINFHFCALIRSKTARGIFRIRRISLEYTRTSRTPITSRRFRVFRLNLFKKSKKTPFRVQQNLYSDKCRETFSKSYRPLCNTPFRFRLPLASFCGIDSLRKVTLRVIVM